MMVSLSIGASRSRVGIGEYVAALVGGAVFKGARLIRIKDAGGDCLAVCLVARGNIGLDDRVSEKLDDMRLAFFWLQQFQGQLALPPQEPRHNAMSQELLVHIRRVGERRAVIFGEE